MIRNDMVYSFSFANSRKHPRKTRFLQPPFLQLGDHIRCQQVHVDAILTLAAGEVSRGKKRSLLVVEKTV